MRKVADNILLCLNFFSKTEWNRLTKIYKYFIEITDHGISKIKWYTMYCGFVHKYVSANPNILKALGNI